MVAAARNGRKHLRLTAKPEIAASACRNCKNRPRIVPTPEDVPAPLRGLSAEMVEALRPLDIDVGPEVRAASTAAAAFPRSSGLGDRPVATPLYWKTSMCESCERLNQQRLEQLQRQEGRTSKHQGDAQSSDSSKQSSSARCWGTEPTSACCSTSTCWGTEPTSACCSMSTIYISGQTSGANAIKPEALP